MVTIGVDQYRLVGQGTIAGWGLHWALYLDPLGVSASAQTGWLAFYNSQSAPPH